MGDEPLAQIIEKLELILAVLRVSNSDKIEALRESLEADPAVAAILEKSDLGIPATELVAEVMKMVPQRERSIQARLAELNRAGVLKMQKVGTKIFYSRSGLI